MSFREKSAWISLLSMAGVYGFYFWTISHAPAATGALHYGPLLIRTIVLLVVIQIILNVALAVYRPGEAQAAADERERLIDLKASRIAYFGLVTGVLVACVFGLLTPPTLFTTNSLLFILVVCEVLRAGCQIVFYRLGA